MSNTAKGSLIVGLGGGIGSGKSVVRKAFETLAGWETVDTDTVAKSLYLIPSVREEMLERLGVDPVTTDSRINKERLRELLRDEEKRMILEEIVHGTLFDMLKEQRAGSDSEVLLVESAILFSSHLSDFCDYTIAVLAPGETRRERTEAREAQNGRESGREFFVGMEERQKKEREMLVIADFTIENYGTHSIILSTEEIIRQIRKKINEHDN